MSLFPIIPVHRRPGDPDFANVVLLVHFDGVDGSTGFTDESNSAHALTAGSAAEVDTAQSLFGGGSLLCPNAAGGYVEADDHADWSFGSGAVTFEWAVRFTSVIAGDAFLSQFGTSGNRAWNLNMASTTVFTFQYTENGSSLANINFSWTPLINTWYQLALTRSGNTWRFYVNGTQTGGDQIAAITLYDPTTVMRISGEATAASVLDGWMDEVRITKGVARYTGASYTVADQAFPDG